eukprot:2724200-Alexandrium_andersonii.AAC.1
MHRGARGNLLVKSAHAAARGNGPQENARMAAQGHRDESAEACGIKLTAGGASSCSEGSTTPSCCGP